MAMYSRLVLLDKIARSEPLVTMYKSSFYSRLASSTLRRMTSMLATYSMVSFDRLALLPLGIWLPLKLSKSNQVGEDMS